MLAKIQSLTNKLLILTQKYMILLNKCNLFSVNYRTVFTDIEGICRHDDPAEINVSFRSPTF